MGVSMSKVKQEQTKQGQTRYNGTQSALPTSAFQVRDCIRVRVGKKSRTDPRLIRDLRYYMGR